jgi:hypothetical protein
MRRVRRFPAGQLAAVVACMLIGACTSCDPETTTFRTIEKGDDSGRPGAAYDVRMDDLPIARVHVWSNGGYVSASDEPMTHVGFEIHNINSQTIAFDTDALKLTLFDNTAAKVPGGGIASVEPAGPSLRPIRPGTAILLGAYFMIPVHPRAVETMEIEWAMRTGDQRYLQVTRFTRDDAFPVVDAPRTAPVDYNPR